jgi:AraC-like DNA-binding protein
VTFEENIALFRELLSVEGNFFTWRYDANGQLTESNCPNEPLFSAAFSLMGCKEQVMAHGSKNAEPILAGSAVGLIWCAAFEKEGESLKSVHVIGPVFTSEISAEWLNALESQEIPNASLSWRKEIWAAIKSMPVIPNSVLVRYALMLHYCVTGEKLNPSDIYRCAGTVFTLDGREVQKDRHKIWETEQELLRMVEEGDLNYKNALCKSQLLSNGVPVTSKDPLRHMKDSIIVYTSLCARAAMTAGISPEASYSLGDAYIQSVEDASNYQELAQLSNSMYEDFIRRVHKHKSQPQYSRQVQRCLDYISSHVEEKISLTDLASSIGYSEYYLSRKFKTETGEAINLFIRKAKMERAKRLLSDTEESVTDIAARLGFCSRSYFAATFSEMEKVTPVEYRDANKKF